jgi:hypothetical protein
MKITSLHDGHKDQPNKEIKMCNTDHVRTYSLVYCLVYFIYSSLISYILHLSEREDDSLKGTNDNHYKRSQLLIFLSQYATHSPVLLHIHTIIRAYFFCLSRCRQRLSQS